MFRSEDADDWCALRNRSGEPVYQCPGYRPHRLELYSNRDRYLEIENSIAPSIDLSGCTSIGDELYVHENDDLESIDLSALQVVDSYVYVYNNADLESMALDSLEEVGSYINVQYHDHLEAISFDSLERSATIFNQSERLLTDLDYPP